MKIEKVMKRGLDQVVAMAEKGNENRYSTKIATVQIEDDEYEFSLRLKKIQENQNHLRSFEDIFGKNPFFGKKETIEEKKERINKIKSFIGKNGHLSTSPDFIKTCFDARFMDAIQSSMFFRDKCETAKDLKADVAKPTNSKFQKKMDEMMEKAKKEKSAINNDTFQHISGDMDAVQNFVGSMQPKPSNEDSSGKNKSVIFGTIEAVAALNSIIGIKENKSVDDYKKSIADASELKASIPKYKEGAKKPPIGIIPQNLFLEKRLFEIQEAKNRFRESKTVIPSEWLREEKEIMEWFGAPKEPANFATEHRKYINGLIQGMKDEMIKNIDVQMEDVSKEMDREKEKSNIGSGMMFCISENPSRFPYGFHTDLFFHEMERRKKE